MSLLLGRIEQEITRHKAAHESHFHWAVIVFAAATAMFSKHGVTKDLWTLASCGFLVNLALWCRAARAYRALSSHWDARDKVYSLLQKNPTPSYNEYFGEVEGLLDGNQNRQPWTKGVASTLFRVGVPEFMLLACVYLWFLYKGISSEPYTSETLVPILLLFCATVWVLVWGLWRPQVKIDFLGR